MVRQADGAESGLTAEEHRKVAKWLRDFSESSVSGDQQALRAEFQEACAEGRTSEAEPCHDTWHLAIAGPRPHYCETCGDLGHAPKRYNFHHTARPDDPFME